MIHRIVNLVNRIGCDLALRCFWKVPIIQAPRWMPSMDNNVILALALSINNKSQ